jgi:hypothetical protein
LAETITGLGDQASMTANQLFHASEAIMTLAGGAEAYAQKSQALLSIIGQSSAFQEKQLAEAQNAIASYEAQYGALLDSADAVYEYMKGLDLATSAGQQAYAGLLDIVDSLALVQSQTEETTQATDELAASLADQVKSIQSLIDEMRFGGMAPGGPTANLSGLQAQIDLMSGQYAQNPNADLLSQLEDLMRQQLDLAGSYYGATSSEYATVFSRIMLTLQSLDRTLASLPQYDVGSSYIPQTQMAIVHKGEQIVPANSTNSSATPIVVHFNISGNVSQSEIQYAVRQSLPYLKKALTRT